MEDRLNDADGTPWAEVVREHGRQRLGWWLGGLDTNAPRSAVIGKPSFSLSMLIFFTATVAPVSTSVHLKTWSSSNSVDHPPHTAQAQALAHCKLIPAQGWPHASSGRPTDLAVGSFPYFS